MIEDMDKFDKRINAFMSACQEIVSGFGEDLLSYRRRHKYTRIIRHTSFDGKYFKNEELYCLIEIETGNIYRPNSISKPDTKRIRGNIWNKGMDVKEMRWYGPRLYRNVGVEG